MFVCLFSKEGENESAKEKKRIFCEKKKKIGERSKYAIKRKIGIEYLTSMRIQRESIFLQKRERVGGIFHSGRKHIIKKTNNRNK